MILIPAWELRPLPKPLLGSRCTFCSQPQAVWFYFATATGTGEPLCSFCFLAQRKICTAEREAKIWQRLERLREATMDPLTWKDQVLADIRVLNLLLGRVVLEDRLEWLHRETRGGN